MNRSLKMKALSFPVLLFLWLTVGFIPTLPAQQEDEQKRPAFEKLDQIRRIKLIEFLDLKEEQSIRYFTREKDFRAAERELFTRRKALIDQLDGMVKDIAGEPDIQKKMGEIAEVDQKILASRWEFTKKCADILTPRQVGKLVVFEQRFQEEVRKAMREFPRKRRMER